MDLSYIINELGEERENYFRAIAPPIIQTSNFAFENIDELRKSFQDEMAQYLYSRGVNPTVDILRKKLAALDGAEDCLVLSTGASAIFISVFANVKAGDHIISVRNPYTWAKRMFDHILPRFGIATTYIDGTNIENFEEAVLPNTSLIYLESPNSWDYALQDLEAVAQLAKSKSIITIIDNSYCSSLYQRPIEYGIDLSLQTATKYIGGHSDTLGGVLCGTNAMMKKIFDVDFLTIGSGIQPFNAWLLLRGLRTLPVRLEKISETTKEVIHFLKEHPKVEEVLFPLDPFFPQFELAKRQMSGACGLFTFILKEKSREKIEKFCNSLQHILIAVSWGGHESLVIPRCSGLPPGEYDPANREHQFIRIYTGLDESAYLVRDLEQAFDKI